MKQKTTFLASTLSALVLTSTLPLAQATPEQQPNPIPTCAPVQVIGVPGSGSTHSNADPEAKQEIQPGWNPAKELEDKFGTDNVHGITVPYPASLGYLYSAQALQGTPEGYTGGYEGVGYANSVEMGVEWAKRYMETTSEQCGDDTNWVLYGFSQGADVAGNIASEVANNRVAGVSPDNIIAVTLISDPRRSHETTSVRQGDDKVRLYAPVPKGIVQENGEISNTNIAGKHGVVGVRDTDFNALYGKVLSLCHEDDFPCATEPGTLISDIANIVEHGTDFKLTDAQMRSLNSVITAASGGNINIPNLLDTALPLLQDASLVAEFRKITTVAEPVIKNGDTEGWIALFDKYQAQINEIAGNPLLKIMAPTVVDIFKEIISLRPEGKVTEAGKASLDQFQEAIKDSQNGTHTSYFAPGGNTDADKARDWMLKGVENALANTTFDKTVSDITASVRGESVSQNEHATPVATSSKVPSQTSSPTHALIHPQKQTQTPDANPQETTVNTEKEQSTSVSTPHVADSQPQQQAHRSNVEENASLKQNTLLAKTGANVLIILTVGVLALIMGFAVYMFSSNRTKKNEND